MSGSEMESGGMVRVEADTGGRVVSSIVNHRPTRVVAKRNQQFLDQIKRISPMSAFSFSIGRTILVLSVVLYSAVCRWGG